MCFAFIDLEENFQKLKEYYDILLDPAQKVNGKVFKIFFRVNMTLKSKPKSLQLKGDQSWMVSVAA